MSLNEVHSKISVFSVNGIYFPRDSHVFCFVCLFGGSHWVFLSLFKITHYLSKIVMQLWRPEVFRFVYLIYIILYFIVITIMITWLYIYYILCSKQDFCLVLRWPSTELLNKFSRLFSICVFVSELACSALFSWFIVLMYVLWKYEQYTSSYSTWYCKSWVCCQMHAISHLIKQFQGLIIICTYSLFFFCVYPFLFYFIFVLCFATELSVHVCCVMGWCSDWLCLGRCPSLCPPFCGTNSGFCVQYLG